MNRNVYYLYNFETHENLSHKQLWLTVYYFMGGAVVSLILYDKVYITSALNTLFWIIKYECVGKPIFWERDFLENFFSECHDKRQIIRFRAVINHILLLQVNISSFEKLDLGHLEIFIWVSLFFSFFRFFTDFLPV